jgi:hypothetical protein
MSVRNLPSVHSSKSAYKPLYRTQRYLVEAKVCLKLFRELLEVLKDIVVILSLIVFFLYGVIQLLQHLKV